MYTDTVYEINILVQVPKILQILLPPRSNTEIAGAPAEYVRDLRNRPASNIGPGTVEA